MSIRNPVLARHFGAVPSDTSSVVSSLDNNENSSIDASAHFSHFGSTAYRKYVKFVPNQGKNENDTDLPDSVNENRPNTGKSSDRTPNSYGIPRSPSLDTSHHPIDEPPHNDLLRRSKGVLEEARKLCAESRANRDAFFIEERKNRFTTNHHDVQQKLEESKTPVVNASFPDKAPSQAKELTPKCIEGDPCHLPFQHCISTSLNSPCDWKEGKFSSASQHGSLQHVLLCVVPNPQEMLARRQKRREQNVVVEYSGQSKYNTVEVYTAPPKQSEVKTLRRSTSQNRQKKRHSTPLLSVDSFTSILDKLTTFLRHREAPMSGTAMLANEDKWRTEEQINRVSPLKEKKVAFAPASIHQDSTQERPSPRKQASKNVPRVPSYAVPTANWLSKGPKDYVASCSVQDGSELPPSISVDEWKLKIGDSR